MGHSTVDDIQRPVARQSRSARGLHPCLLCSRGCLAFVLVMAFVAVPPMLLPADVALIQVNLKKLNTNNVSLNDATEAEVDVIIHKLRST